jgi:hypothetical protein
MRGGSIHHLLTLSEWREGAECCSKVSIFYIPGGAKIWTSQGADWISTGSGSERPLAKTPLATAPGTDSSPQSRYCCAQHIDQRGWNWRKSAHWTEKLRPDNLLLFVHLRDRQPEHKKCWRIQEACPRRQSVESGFSKGSSVVGVPGRELCIDQMAIHPFQCEPSHLRQFFVAAIE